jgi:hypothetical protein
MKIPARLAAPGDTERLRFAVWNDQEGILFSALRTDLPVRRYISEGVWPQDRIREFVAREIAGYHEHGFCL